MVLADPQSIPPLGDKVGRVALIDGWVLLSTQNAHGGRADADRDSVAKGW